jgi:hypothetical protein
VGRAARNGDRRARDRAGPHGDRVPGGGGRKCGPGPRRAGRERRAGRARRPRQTAERHLRMVQLGARERRQNRAALDRGDNRQARDRRPDPGGAALDNVERVKSYFKTPDRHALPVVVHRLAEFATNLVISFIPLLDRRSSKRCTL